MTRRLFLGSLVCASLAGRAGAAPVCDGIFHFEYVDGTVCGDGSPTGLAYVCQPGSTLETPLMVYFDGGGTCWDGSTCNCTPDSVGVCTNPEATISAFAYPREASFDGVPWADSYFGAPGQFNGPTSPFGAAWNIVFIPYCTGDVHSGDAVNTYFTSLGAPLVMHHHGYRNATVDLAEAGSLFPTPDRVVITGSSAGGLGTECNLAQARATWPSAPMYALNNSGGPLRAPFVPDMPGLEAIYNTGATCPTLPAPSETRGWSPGAMFRYNRNVLDVRIGFSDDYADSTIDGFACALGAHVNPDTQSCAASVRDSLILTYEIDIAGTGAKVYYHDGACHAERELDGNTVESGSSPSCDYDTMVQHGVKYRDWVRGWLEVPGFAWDDVR
jgi:hypothetical protein